MSGYVIPEFNKISALIFVVLTNAQNIFSRFLEHCMSGNTSLSPPESPILWFASLWRKVDRQQQLN